MLKVSEQFGSRYATLVADGDEKVWTRHMHVNNYKEGIKFEKFDCSNHTQKKSPLGQKRKERRVGRERGGLGWIGGGEK